MGEAAAAAASGAEQKAQGGVAVRWRLTNGVDLTLIDENATEMGVAAIIDHGFCTAEEAGAFGSAETL